MKTVVNPGRFLVFLFMAFQLTSCSKKIEFPTSSVVPAAQGHVKIKKDSNRNFSIDVRIKNLAEPDRLQPPKDVYIVWMETKNSGIKNIGQLKITRDLLSNNLKGNLQAVSSFEPSLIFITAEERADIQFPGAQVVLKTRSF